jgi:hypothetical protein
MRPREALKIKALAGMPRKKAKFEVLINQQLTSAIAFIAPVTHLGDIPDWPTPFLCISVNKHPGFGPK